MKSIAWLGQCPAREIISKDRRQAEVQSVGLEHAIMERFQEDSE